MNESFGMALWMKSRSMSLSAFVCVCVGMDCNAADSFRTKKRRRKTLKVLNFFAGFKLFIPSVVV